MKVKESNTPIEVWGGIECTVNRVGDQFFDQLQKSGHYERDADLQLIAELGLKKIRFPVLWENIVPDLKRKPNWAWTDKRLTALRTLEITPIVGLLHHGSGPAYTSLLDPEFPERFAAYALQVARRYPWIRYYTPINEPLTTARFSALYGFWYPHLADDLSFSKALLNQILAVKKAMEAIKSVNPSAQLVQTEDLGKIHSTEVLAYQADFENERRWITFDLLCGKVDANHPMWQYFLWAGIEKSKLEELQTNPCPPDIIGINHYLSSDRYLDDRTQKYPPHLRGGNGRHQYADIEAIRVGPLEPEGFYELMKETCLRYELPVAVSEVHMGGTREEQLRWFFGAWKAAVGLKKEGYNVKAITAWALLGLYDWNSLLLESKNFYESGSIDVRGKNPRITALGKLVRSLALGEPEFSAISQLPGWWQRAERVHVVQPGKNLNLQAIDYATSTLAPPVIITGAPGTLAKAFARVCQTRGVPYRLLTRQDLDITNPVQTEKIIDELKPWAVINAAGYQGVDEAETNVLQCFSENAMGPANLAAICYNTNVKFLSFSSNLVFNGRRNKPYLEHHVMNPLGIFGMSKKLAEEKVLLNHPKALMVRTSAFFGPWDDGNFVARTVQSLMKKKQFPAAQDQCISPTYVPDLVNACLDLLIDGEFGIWNITNPCEVSWADFAIQAANILGYDSRLVVPLASKKMNFLARRPSYSALGSNRGIFLPTLEDGLHKFQHQYQLANETIS